MTQLFLTDDEENEIHDLAEIVYNLFRLDVVPGSSPIIKLIMMTLKPTTCDPVMWPLQRLNQLYDKEKQLKELREQMRDEQYNRYVELVKAGVMTKEEAAKALMNSSMFDYFI